MNLLDWLAGRHESKRALAEATAKLEETASRARKNRENAQDELISACELFQDTLSDTITREVDGNVSSSRMDR